MHVNKVRLNGPSSFWGRSERGETLKIQKGGCPKRRERTTSIEIGSTYQYYVKVTLKVDTSNVALRHDRESLTLQGRGWPGKLVPRFQDFRRQPPGRASFPLISGRVVNPQLRRYHSAEGITGSDIPQLLCALTREHCSNYARVKTLL